MPHPGTVTYKHNGVVTEVRRAEDVPEEMRFFVYDDVSVGSRPGRPRRTPIVEVDANDMGAERMEVLEYGPDHGLLRTTVGFTGRVAR